MIPNVPIWRRVEKTVCLLKVLPLCNHYYILWAPRRRRSKSLSMKFYKKIIRHAAAVPLSQAVTIYTENACCCCLQSEVNKKGNVSWIKRQHLYAKFSRSTRCSNTFIISRSIMLYKIVLAPNASNEKWHDTSNLPIHLLMWFFLSFYVWFCSGREVEPSFHPKCLINFLTHIRTQVHTCMHSYTYIHAHTQSHTYTSIRVHIYKHKHATHT